MIKHLVIGMLLVSMSIQFKTSTRTQITPLESILSIDPSNWSCESPTYKEQLGAQHDIDQWIDILKHKDGFDGDLQVLAMVKSLVDRVLLTVEHIQSGSFIQVKQLHHQISKHFKSLSQIESTSSWYDINDILGYLEVLNKAKTDEDKLQLAQTIATKIAELISQITEIQLQLNTIPVEIDQLYDLATRVNEKVTSCKDYWAPQLEADAQAEEEERRKEQEQEAERLRAEEEARAAAEAAAEEERRREEEARELEELKNRVDISPEEAELLEQQAEKELAWAEEEDQEAEAALEAAEQVEQEAETDADSAEKEAQEAADKAAEAQEALEDAKEREEEACLDADEAQRRLKEAQEAAEEARKRAEEAQRLADEAAKAKECEPEPEPVPEVEPAEEEFEEEFVWSEEEDGCTDEALEDLIDTLIDAATGPAAYQPGCGYPGCQEQPIIIIVEDDEETPAPQPDPVPEPVPEPEEEVVVEENVPEEVVVEEPEPEEEVVVEEPAPEEEVVVEVPEEEEAEVEPTPDDQKVSEEEEVIEETVEETVEEEEEEEDDDFGRLGFPEEETVEEIVEEIVEETVEETVEEFVEEEEPELVQLVYTLDEKTNSDTTQTDSPWEKVVTHSSETRIKKSVEYSYGLWTYFRYNGNVKISEKKEALAVFGLSGDDTSRLVTTIGEGFYNFIVYEGDQTTELQLDYGKFLDAEWIYVYFGYKEGKAHGYVYWARSKVIKTVTFTVTQPAIQSTIKFSSGIWTGFKGFNGVITSVRVVLNKNSFVETEDEMKTLIETQYTVPTDDELEYTEDKHYDKVEYENTLTDPNFHWDLNGHREYSVSTWFRYVRRTEKAFQLIFRLTSNEPDSGVVAHGDKVLSLWQTENNDYEFTTYTVEEKDKFSDITETVTISQESQQLWTYSYFGYNMGDFEYYIEWPDSTSSKKFTGWHVVAKYWALYLGQDQKYSFHGKTAYTTIRFGKGAFGVATEFDDYKTGKIKLWPGVQLKSYDPKWVTHTTDGEYDTLLHEEPDWVTDGVYEYGFGMWTKFFITNPKRIYEKPERILVGRLGFTDQDEAEFAVYIGQGSYEFWAGSVRPVKYTKNLDGYWNYIFFSYSKLKQIAVGYVNFQKLSQVQRTVFEPFDADPANKYVRFYVGQWKTMFGFNGRMAHAVVRLGRGSFVNEITDYETWITNYPVPVDGELGNKDYEIQSADNKDTESYETFLYEDGAAETEQYSVYGWFKYYGDLANTDAMTIIRLTNNEVGHLADATLLGDRTLTAVQKGGNMVFGTYDIGLIDTDYTVSREAEYELGEYRGLWMYIWVGYSRSNEQTGWFLGFPDISKGGIIKKTLHFSPKYLAVYFGKDGINSNFVGKSRHVHACYGSTECWYFVNKVDIDDSMPAWIPYKLNNYFEWYIEKDDEAQIVARDDNAAIDVEFTQTNFPGSDLEAIYEYGIGLWTRWLMNYPFILLEKADSHSIFRFTTNAAYEDAQNNGDRTVSAFVGRGVYTFSTYDAILNKNEIATGTQFDQELEGYWNFVYFCYQRIPTQPKGIGYVYLSNVNVVKRVEIDSAKHWLLRDYARLVVGKKEFGHSAFQGKLFDPRAFLGKGSYIESSEDLINTLVPKFRAFPPYKEKQDNEPVQVEKAKMTQRVFKAYEEKYSGVFEYSVYGFAKGNKLKNVTDWTTLVRVTQNTPDIQADNDNAGDRTLSIFADKGKWVYSTYDYGDIETVDDDNGAINHEFDMGKYWGKWTYFYFGYSFKLKQAYAYIRQIDQSQNSYLFENVYHFVPNYLSVFFSEDGYGKQFDGEAFDWYLGIGDGAFTTTPEPREWPVDPAPPPDRILSALLANQGFNSGRIVKSVTFLQLDGSVNLIQEQEE